MQKVTPLEHPTASTNRETSPLPSAHPVWGLIHGQLNEIHHMKELPIKTRMGKITIKIKKK
jgi:hypothetical protein